MDKLYACPCGSSEFLRFATTVESITILDDGEIDVREDTEDLSSEILCRECDKPLDI